jgi:integrase
VVTLIKLPGFAYPEIEPLTVDRARALLNAVRGHRLEALYRLALSLGMRQGELIRLTWNDVDMHRRTLVVRQSKTRAGRRTIELPDTLFEALKKHKEHIENEQVYAHHWTDHGLVFPSEVGTPLAARNIFRHFKALLIKAGLPQTIRFHDLRHSCAAFLIAEGVDLHIVKQLLGHSKISITSDFYGHLLPGVGGEALSKIDKLLQ